MSTTTEITVGDTGITLSGTIVHPALKGLLSTAGLSCAVSCKRVGGGPDLFSNQTAIIGALDSVNGTLKVSYRLQAADVDTDGLGTERWVLTLLDGGKITSPGPTGKQTFLQINP